MKRKSIRIIADTDSLGKVSSSHFVDDFGQGELEFNLSAKLLHPYDTEFSGIVDIESPQHGSENYAKTIQFRTGDEVHLGRWRLTPEVDKIKIVGETTPRKPDEVVSFELHADLED